MPSVRAALETYRKVPHTATGEAPLFLFTGQEPVYSFDHLLPTRDKNIWDSSANTLDIAQLKVAYGLARKNTCLARKKNKVVIKRSAHELKVGDRVYRRNYSNSKSKLDPTWLPGFRIVGKETGRTMIIEHSESGVKARVNVCDLKWADPVAELLQNSQLDVFPGSSKLYFHAGDLENLNWPAMQDLPEMEKQTQEKLEEAVRDRSRDTQQQSSTPQASPQEEGEDTNSRPKRNRRLPARYRDAINMICSLFYKIPGKLV